MRPDDLLAGKEYVTAADLSKLPIIWARRSNVKNELANGFGDYYKDLHVLFTSNLSTNVAIMVQRGLGYSLVIEGFVLAWKGGQPFGAAVEKFRVSYE